MPAFVAWLVWAIGSALVSWVVRVLLGFGVGLVATEVALPPLRAWLVTYFNGMPSTIVSLLGYMGVDRGLTLILSALVIAAASRVSLKKRTGAPP